MNWKEFENMCKDNKLAEYATVEQYEKIYWMMANGARKGNIYDIKDLTAALWAVSEQTYGEVLFIVIDYINTYGEENELKKEKKVESE